MSLDVTPQNTRIRVSGYEERQFGSNTPYHVYFIDLTVRDHSWTIVRRFSQLHAFNEALHGKYYDQAIPEFPPKRPFTDKLTLAADRQALLETYLSTLAQNTTLLNCSISQQFFEFKRHIPIRGVRKLKVLMPLPDLDWDPTEAAVTWKILTRNGIEVVIATEEGKRPEPDPLQVSPDGVVFGALGASPDAKSCYYEMRDDPSMQAPIAWRDIVPSQYDGLFLTGGHAPGMRQYLENSTLQQKIVEFWKLDRPVGAVCHGTLLLARCVDPDTERSVLYGRTTSTLPGYMENLGYYATAWKHGRLYHTYDTLCEEEVRFSLKEPEDLFVGPFNIRKGTPYNHNPAFIHQDRKYVSARWPGDVYVLGERLVELVTAELRQSASYGFDSPAHHTPSAAAASSSGSSSAVAVGGFGFDAADFEIDLQPASTAATTTSTGSLRNMLREQMSAPGSAHSSPAQASQAPTDDVEYV